jgi:hypothetical protein
MPIRWRVWQIKQYGSQSQSHLTTPFDCAITLHQSHGIKVRLESGEVGRVKEICV